MHQTVPVDLWEHRNRPGLPTSSIGWSRQWSYQLESPVGAASRDCQWDRRWDRQLESQVGPPARAPLSAGWNRKGACSQTEPGFWFSRHCLAMAAWSYDRTVFVQSVCLPARSNQHQSVDLTDGDRGQRGRYYGSAIRTKTPISLNFWVPGERNSNA